MTVPDEEEEDIVSGVTASQVGSNFPAKRPRAMEVDAPSESLKQLSEEARKDLGECFSKDLTRRSCSQACQHRRQRHGNIGELPTQEYL